MEKQFKEFINHLYSVGIVNSQSVKEILQIYQKQKLLNPDSSMFANSMSSLRNPLSQRSNEMISHTMKDIMQSVLNEYLNKLDANSIQNIAFDMVSKYSENNFLNKTKYAKKHLMYYMRFHNQKLSFYFKKWKANLKKKWKISEKQVVSTEMKKEQDSLMSCTFKPKINKGSRSMCGVRLKPSENNRLDTFTRLYTDHFKMKTKRDIKREQMDKKESQLMKDFPQNTNPNHSFYTQNDLCSKSFLDRIGEYEDMKNKRRYDLVRKNEEEENMTYTFTPSINSSYSFRNSTKSETRLYGDFYRRVEKMREKVRENEEKINSSCNRGVPQGKKVDINKLESLYVDYKRHKLMQKKLKQKVELEEGVTFKPQLYSNNFTPQHNFYERQDLLLATKKTNAEILKQQEMKEYERESKYKRQVNYSPEERKEITNNIVSRLYKPAVQKLLLKGDKRENQFSKRKYYSSNQYVRETDYALHNDINNNNQVYVNNINVYNVIDSSERLRASNNNNNVNNQGRVINDINDLDEEQQINDEMDLDNNDMDNINYDDRHQIQDTNNNQQNNLNIDFEGNNENNLGNNNNKYNFIDDLNSD